MNKQLTFPKVALGTWSWGSGAFGGNQVFGNSLTEAQLEQAASTTGIDTQASWEGDMA